ncbi:hypothetical protein PSY31_23795, partial [Shigella flexneri]|nr:hypothetical protein [Shigella flexneri]
MTANELLAASVQKSNSLETKLVDAREKAETVVVDLEKERQNISSLKEELMAVKIENFKDKEARKSLEENLEEATNALDEM